MASKVVRSPPLSELTSVISAFCDKRTVQSLDTKPVAAIHAKVQDCVQAIRPTTTPYIFGSTAVLGVHEPGSDVDFVCLSAEEVQNGMGGDSTSEVAKALQSDFLTRLHDGFAQQYPLWRLQLVRRARVPVLRVKGGMGAGSIDFDITAGRRNGMRNSALLRRYFEQVPMTRWMSSIVKWWSKSAGLNSSAGDGCLTSYGFNILVVFFLLKRGHVTFVPPESLDVALIEPLPPHLPLHPPNEAEAQDLGALLLDFVKFYREEFNMEKEVITLSRSTETLKEQLRWTTQAEDMARIGGEKLHYRLCIEDPYEYNLNVGRNITPFKYSLFLQHLKRAQETGLLLLLPPSQVPR